MTKAEDAANIRSGPNGTRTAARTEPRQERSRLRQKMVLDAAEEMIADVGYEGLSMREVCRRAGVPIASVYHYYPSAAAIIRALSERHLSRISEYLEERLTALLASGDRPGLPIIIDTLIRDIAAFLRRSTAAPAIWAALGAERDLRCLDREDTLAIAARLAPHLISLLPGLPASDARPTAIVLLESVAASLMFALEEDPLYEKVIDVLGRFVTSALIIYA